MIDLYGDVVEIATTAPEFVTAAEALLRRSAEEERQWRTRAARLVTANDWDAVAAKMLDVMSRARAATLLPAADQSAVALTA
ncbi:MAG: hypothetical protein H0T18_00675 [Chloroflexia bacterium]|nr:hypothetical protein [Chloroflexia bacterium]